MSDTITINSEVALAEAKRELDRIWHEHKYVEIEVKHKAGRITLTQSKSLHLFCEWLAQTLNDAGYDMRETLRQDIDVPWTKISVKEHLWRPIQKALTEKHSTQEITTVDPTRVHEVLSRELGQRLGIQCPEWPKRERAA